MQLMTKEIENSIPALYSQENNKDPMAVVKFFDPCGRYTFYVLEGERVTLEEGRPEYTFSPGPFPPPKEDWLFFGWCVSPLGDDCDEFGYTRLSELESVKGPFGLGIERDKFFTPKPLSKIKGA